jgi:hypothetical protein
MLDALFVDALPIINIEIGGTQMTQKIGNKTTLCRWDVIQRAVMKQGSHVCPDILE